MTMTTTTLLCPEEECNASVNTEHDLRAHLSHVHFRYFPYECDTCGKVYTTEQRFLEHCRNEHWSCNRRIDVDVEAKLDALLQQAIGNCTTEKTDDTQQVSVATSLPTPVAVTSDVTAKPTAAESPVLRSYVTTTTPSVLSTSQSTPVSNVVRGPTPEPMSNSMSETENTNSLSASQSIQQRASQRARKRTFRMTESPLSTPVTNTNDDSSSSATRIKEPKANEPQPEPDETNRMCKLCLESETQGHWKERHNKTGKIYKCDVCEQTFFAKWGDAERHHDLVHLGQQKSYSVVAPPPKMITVDDSDKSSSATGLRCDVCGQTLNFKGAHDNLHDATDKYFQCVLCPQTFFKHKHNGVAQHQRKLHPKETDCIRPINFDPFRRMSIIKAKDGGAGGATQSEHQQATKSTPSAAVPSSKPSSVETSVKKTGICENCGLKKYGSHNRVHDKTGKQYKCAVCPGTGTYFKEDKEALHHIHKYHKNNDGPGFVRLLAPQQQSQPQLNVKENDDDKPLSEIARSNRLSDNDTKTQTHNDALLTQRVQLQPEAVSIAEFINQLPFTDEERRKTLETLNSETEVHFIMADSILKLIHHSELATQRDEVELSNIKTDNSRTIKSATGD